METLIAIVILASALLALAPLTTLSSTANVEARHVTTATILAIDKVEELRATPAPPVSPADALDRNAPGFSDFFDAAGTPIGGAAVSGAPTGAAFIRRWSVAMSGPGGTDPIAIQVSVFPRPPGAGGGRTATRHRGEVRLSALVSKAP